MSTVETQPAPSEATSFAAKLRKQTAAVRLRLRKFGVRKVLTADQRRQAAEVFSATPAALYATKQLLNTRDKAYRRVNKVRFRAVESWRKNTVPYPDVGVRLIQRKHCKAFNERMAGFQTELAEATAALQEAYNVMREDAGVRLGDLFKPSDYPENIAAEFAIEWDWPSIDAPEYLKQLNPEMYEKEQARIAARFDEAVQLAEDAFIHELHELLKHLVDRLRGREDGKPKIFRDSAVENLKDFFKRFSELNIRSCPQLDQMVEQAQQIVGGVTPASLRTDQTARDTIAQSLGGVSQAIDQMMENRPCRLFEFEEEPEKASRDE